MRLPSDLSGHGHGAVVKQPEEVEGVFMEMRELK